MFLNSKFTIFVFKCCILLKPVLGGVDGNLHFQVLSMNGLNQTESATFYYFVVLGFLLGFCFSLFLFVMINQEKLLYKLHFYGIRRVTLKWIKFFLDNRSQSVVTVVNWFVLNTFPVSLGVPRVRC
jgi:hypothetical protein